MDWKATIGAVAPTLASALGGPLAGLAVDAIGKAFGWSESTQEKVQDALTKGQLSGDQILALKQAEIALVQQEKELGFKFAELDAGDRKDARDMQKVTRSQVPAVLSIGVTLGYFGVLLGMMSGGLKAGDSQALLLMLGSLSTAWGVVMAFWFGSTAGSAEKSRLLAQSQPPK
jgi:hypothetical protein